MKLLEALRDFDRVVERVSVPAHARDLAWRRLLPAPRWICLSR